MSSKLTELYSFNKEKLIETLRKANQDTEGNFEQLRGRLRQHIISTMGKNDDTQAPNASTNESTLISLISDEATPPPSPLASAMDRVRKWGCHFDGTKDARNFLERICELQESYGITEEQLLRCLPELLKGQALLWHRNNRAAWANWKDFEESFRLYYIPFHSENDLEEEIQQRKQKPGEPASEYITEIQTLIRRYGQLSPARQLERIHRNLLPEYREFIRRNSCVTVTALLQTAIEYEGILRDKKTRTPLPAKTTAPKKQQNTSNLDTISPDYNRETCC